MGCGSSSLGVIREEDINPPIIHSIPNSRIKTNLFPEGEIYYLRNSETLKQGAQNENKHFSFLRRAQNRTHNQLQIL